MTLRGLIPIGLLAVLACGTADSGASARWSTFRAGPVPPELKRAEVWYNSYCISCHGREGRGEGLGPPLLDSLFLPPLLSDEAAVRAVEAGVNQRRYSFGAMPPVPRLSRPQAEQVIAYVRWFQRQAWPGQAPTGTNQER